MKHYEGFLIKKNELFNLNYQRLRNHIYAISLGKY